MPSTGELARDLPQVAHALKEAARSFHVASNPDRLDLLLTLSQGSRCLTDIAPDLGMDRRAIHAHLRTLVQFGLAQSSRVGSALSYEITTAGQEVLRAAGLLAVQEVAHPVSLPAAKPSPGSTPIERVNAILKAFADPTRLRLVNLLASREEICACHLQGALELPQSTISRHLAILRDAGIVIGRRAQKWVYYRLVRPANGIHGALLEHMGPGADGDPVFESDRRRLDKLSPCKKTLPR